MKKLNLFAVVFTVFIIFNSNKSFSQAWFPDPVKSPYLEAMTGTWVSDPYMFMGNTSTDVVTYNMILNGQFMEVKVIRSDEKGVTMYEGMEILRPGVDGSFSGSSFDVTGNSQVQTYSGSKDGSKVLFTGSSPVGTGTREIIIDRNTMTQNVTFTMGKDKPVQKITIVYKKK